MFRTGNEHARSIPISDKKLIVLNKKDEETK